MKGNEKLITVLNSLLVDEFTVIYQYITKSEICENWGYNKLHVAFQKQIAVEMQHAKWLIQRILFFEGSPVVSKLNAMKTPKTVSEMISNDEENELKIINEYNNAIKLAREVADQGTVVLLSKILYEEEDNIHWAEKQNAQIEQMGLENYLANQA